MELPNGLVELFENDELATLRTKVLDFVSSDIWIREATLPPKVLHVDVHSRS